MVNVLFWVLQQIYKIVSKEIIWLLMSSFVCLFVCLSLAMPFCHMHTDCLVGLAQRSNVFASGVAPCIILQLLLVIVMFLEVGYVCKQFNVKYTILVKQHDTSSTLLETNIHICAWLVEGNSSLEHYRPCKRGYVSFAIHD